MTLITSALLMAALVVDGNVSAGNVDPFIGTDGAGHTMPAACAPFGLVQAGPDTGHIAWEYCSGYAYRDRRIVGFSQTHLSGTGWMDLGDVMIMPFTGSVARAEFPTSAFRKETESASPGTYAVTLDEAGARVEIAATPHVALYRILFSGEARLLLDTQYGFVARESALTNRVVSSTLQKIGTSALEGTCELNHWVRRKMAWHIDFSHPFIACEELPMAKAEKGRRVVLTFAPGAELLVKIALSGEGGLEGARKNLAHELPDWDFDRVVATTRRQWEDILSRVAIEGTPDARRTLYTALYHLCIQPNNLADVGETPFYTTFSLWDAFRAAYPLYEILAPERVPALIESMLRQSRRTGYLPIFTVWGQECQCMIGTHSIPPIVSWYQRQCELGRVDTNYWQGVYAKVKDTLTRKHVGRRKEQWDLLDKYGYYPFDSIKCESVSRTLECAYDDWCAGKMAEALGHAADAAFFLRRSENWRNLYDAESGWMRGRDSKGQWRTPFDQYEYGTGWTVGNDFTEGNTFQYTWHVMQNVEGLADAMGGRTAFVRKLDSIFVKPPVVRGLRGSLGGQIGQYVHGNEPSQHIPYLYALVGRSDRTAETVREICDRFYRPRPDGLCGNDDCGQMSAWYVFSALGFYPVNPCSGEYVIGAPQIPGATLRLANGKTLRMRAEGLSPGNRYVKRVLWNGRTVTGPTLKRADLLRGGELVFEMTACDEAVERARVDVYANSFREGGWKLDVQFMDAMGSPYLLAHGLGTPVPDATATANVPETGAWRVYVRTRQWVKGAGRFQLLVDGKPLAKTLGTGSETWSWEDGGTVELKAGEVRLALRDLDGFDGRCAGVVLVKGGDAPTGPIAVTDRGSEQDYNFDFVVVGGGLSGCCAAVAAARRGLKVALVQDRPVPGGNASGEVRVWSAGEIRYPLVRELRGEFMNMRYENNLSDSRRIAILEREPNLRCFYWHRAFGVEKLGAAISSVKALDVMGNRVVRFRAPLFCDTTGDGWIGFWAGADWRYGREGQDETGEKYAPAKGDRQTLGSSIMWQSADTTGDAPFSAPWAEPFACGLAKTAGDWNWEFGLRQNILEEGEAVRDRILLAIYGAFSNAKKDPANAHRKLVTCPFVLGKRETRRLMGDHIFCEKDVTEKTLFDDAVAAGSWSVDLHYTIDEKIPFLTRCEQPHFGRYWIPYRSLYSRNVPNLFMAGRCFSCTHVGLGSPRVMNTLAQLGCAVGEAAAMCRKGGYSPRGLYAGGHARELQRNLGGSFPGNPDPATKDWLYVDDEDKTVTFDGPWCLGWNCNGGQLGDRTHFASGADAKATYPLPVKTKGLYKLKGLVPHLFHYQDTPIARLSITSGDKVTTVDWSQLPESGFWRDLATLDLEPGATLVLEASPAKKSPAPVADGFALVPEK